MRPQLSNFSSVGIVGMASREISISFGEMTKFCGNFYLTGKFSIYHNLRDYIFIFSPPIQLHPHFPRIRTTGVMRRGGARRPSDFNKFQLDEVRQVGFYNKLNFIDYSCYPLHKPSPGSRRNGLPKAGRIIAFSRFLLL